MAIIIKIDIVYRVFGEILNSSHMTRATIPREGDDMQDRRGAVQTSGVGRCKMSLPLVPDANHPASPTRSQVDDWETKCSSNMPRTWTGSGRGDWDVKLPREH